MPLYKDWKHHNQYVAIWKVDEPEIFFEEATGLSSSHHLPKRRFEYLVPRFLLLLYDPAFPLRDIYTDPFGKPRLPKDEVWFSFTHAHPYVAIMVQKNSACGIDLQTWHPRILMLQEKFLTPQEQGLLGNDEKLITAAWCAKEAVFKCMGQRLIEQNEELQIEHIDREKHQLLLNFNAKKILGQYPYKYAFYGDFALSYNL